MTGLLDGAVVLTAAELAAGVGAGVKYVHPFKPSREAVRAAQLANLIASEIVESVA
jgi:hypothetical protein